MNVKIFGPFETATALEDALNDWIRKNEFKYLIMDLKYSSNEAHYSALMTYRMRIKSTI